MLRALAFALLFAGCAPSTDLTIPIPEDEIRGERIALARMDLPASGVADSTVITGENPFWGKLSTELTEQLAFERVEYVDAPEASAFEERSVLSQNPSASGRARSGWRTLTLPILSDPGAVAPEADVLIVIDDLVAYEGQEVFNGVAALLPGVGATRKQGRGITLGMTVTIYRRGVAMPIGAGPVSAFGEPSGVFSNRTDDESLQRALRDVVEDIGKRGGLARR